MRLGEAPHAPLPSSASLGAHPAAHAPEKLDLAVRLLAEGKGRANIARMIGVGPATLRRALNAKE